MAAVAGEMANWDSNNTEIRIHPNAFIYSLVHVTQYMVQWVVPYRSTTPFKNYAKMMER